MSVQGVTLFSEILRLHTDLNVVLPKDAELDGSDEKYKVLWLFHGANGDCNEWLYLSPIVEEAMGQRLAIVMPSIYDSFSMNMEHGYQYATYLEHELMPQVRRLYPMLSEKREDNFVAGASMGGYAAVHWAVNRPDCFCAAGAFAGALLAGKIYTRYLQGIQPGGPEFLYAFGDRERMFHSEYDLAYTAEKMIADGRPLPRLYMLCGTEDFGYELNCEARDALRRAGMDVTWRQVPGVHGFHCWNPHLPDFLRWLTEKEEQ